MKQELTLAIGLLALGCWLTLGHFRSGNLPFMPENLDQASESAGLDEESLINDPQLAHAGYVQQATTQNSFGVPTLHDIAATIERSQSFGCEIQMEAALFQQNLEANGHYLQLGQGSGRHLVDLRFRNQTGQSNRIYQLCDGRFLYNLQSNGTTQDFEFVDLKRIQDRAFDVSAFQLVSVGGIGGLLRQLSNNYRLSGPKRTLDGHFRWQGKIHPEVLRNLGVAAKNSGIGEEEFQESQALPDQASITLMHDEQLGWVPVAVTFQRSDVGEEQTDASQLLFQFHSYQVQTQVDESLFVLKTNNLAAQDLTENYLATLDGIHDSRLASRAESEAETRER